jgi:hypothetical protein
LAWYVDTKASRSVSAEAVLVAKAISNDAMAR